MLYYAVLKIHIDYLLCCSFFSIQKKNNTYILRKGKSIEVCCADCTHTHFLSLGEIAQQKTALSVFCWVAGVKMFL